jgi:hypothetical protein
MTVGCTKIAAVIGAFLAAGHDLSTFVDPGLDVAGDPLELFVGNQRPHLGINGLKLDNAVPFGGFKESGIGRVGGPEGLEAYQEIKSVYLPD